MKKSTKEADILKTLFKPISMEGIRTILNQMESCICKVYIDDPNIIYGFFMKIPYNSINLPVLITNTLILKKKNSKNNKTIELTMNDDKIYKKIELNDNRKIFKIIKYDIVLIEINPIEDKISNYLVLDDNLNKEEENLININKSVYTFEYSKENNLMVLCNIINNKDFNENSPEFNIKNNSNSYPILSLDNFKIIGIKNLNISYNIKYVINEFNKQYNNTKKILLK